MPSQPDGLFDQPLFTRQPHLIDECAVCYPPVPFSLRSTGTTWGSQRKPCVLTLYSYTYQHSTIQLRTRARDIGVNTSNPPPRNNMPHSPPTINPSPPCPATEDSFNDLSRRQARSASHATSLARHSYFSNVASPSCSLLETDKSCMHNDGFPLY
jgi:hypothetical protein